MDNSNIAIQELSNKDAEAIAVSVLSRLAALAPNWTDQPRQSLQAFLELADSTRDRIRTHSLRTGTVSAGGQKQGASKV